MLIDTSSFYAIDELLQRIQKRERSPWAYAAGMGSICRLLVHQDIYVPQPPMALSWTPWKESVLARLDERTLIHLVGHSDASDAALDAVRSAARMPKESQPWIDSIRKMLVDPAYLSQVDPIIRTAVRLK